MHMKLSALSKEIQMKTVFLALFLLAFSSKSIGVDFFAKPIDYWSKERKEEKKEHTWYGGSVSWPSCLVSRFKFMALMLRSLSQKNNWEYESTANRFLYTMRFNASGVGAPLSADALPPASRLNAGCCSNCRKRFACLSAQRVIR